MGSTSTLDAATVEATPMQVAEQAASLPLLDGDEVIQLSIKPSLWYIPIASFRFLATTAVMTAIVLAFTARNGWSPTASLLLQALALVALARLAVAALQWASRLYVLTNRRVMRFRGVFSVDVAQCLLMKITTAELRVAWYQRGLRLGTIRTRPVSDTLSAVAWEQVGRPTETQEMLLRAINRARSS